MPSFWDKVKATAKPVTERVSKNARTFHSLTSREAAEATYQKAERLSGEISGFLSGMIRVAVSGLTGLVGGTAFGLRAASPTELKKIRMAAESDKFETIGHWTRQETRKVDGQEVNLLIATLTKGIDGAPAEDADYVIPMSRASRANLTIEGKKNTPCVVIPVFDEESGRITGFIVAAEDSKVIYRYLDA